MNNNCILIPSYDKHRIFLEKCLYTIQKCTSNDLRIYVIISQTDEKYFSQYEHKFSNVKLLLFSKVVQLLENLHIDESDIFKKYGKYNYQSLKKFYGLYYLFYYGFDNVIIFDSETMIIRPINITNLINNYINKPFLVCSKSTIKSNKLHTDVDETTRQILNISNYNGWFLEYYLWIYEKHIFSDLFKYLLVKYNKNMINLISICSNIFIEIIYQTFICINNKKYCYKIIDFDEYILNKYCENYTNVIQIFNGISPLRPIEDCRELIERGYYDIVKKMYDDNKFIVYKTKDTEKSLQYIKGNEQIKICASEYSDIVFSYFYPNYIYDIEYNHNFIHRNLMSTIIDGQEVYRIDKKTNQTVKLLWIGYEITFPNKSIVKFSLELLFETIKNITKRNFIAFKRHNPYELITIPIHNIIINKWKSYEFMITINNEHSDLYIIIFDDAPECNVLIRNFNFAISKK
jgi:hypothetical protein